MPNERLIQTQAPIDRPTFAVLIEGEDISREYQLAALTVIKQVNRISTAKILLYDGNPASGAFEISSSELFIPGKEVEICGGYHSLEATLFRGIITGHGIKARQRRPSLLSIECRHSAFRMSLYRRSAYFVELKDSDLFSRLAENYSIDSEIEDTSVEHAELVQYNCTDWDFMLTRAEANGRHVLTNRSELQIGPPDFSADPVQTLTYGATLLEFEAEIDARDQIASVSSESWDSAGQELFSRDGSAEEVQAPGDLLFEELADVAAQPPPVQKSGGQLKEDELQAWADARLLKQRLAKVQGRARCTGIDVNPGDLIDLEGVGERFRGRAFVSGVRHEFSGGPWTTDIDIGLPAEWFAETFPINSPPASGLLPAVSGLQIGVVTDLEDPDGEDRIKVRVPVISTEEDGLWARVSCLDAGAERGTFWRPEIDDEVVLGFLNDDPRDAIVLGSLNSSGKPAPLSGSNDNHEKGIVTRSGMKMIWNDDEVNLTVEFPRRHKLVFSETDSGVLIEDDSSNRIELNSSGISYESASDIKIKASGDIALEATNVELAASAQLKVEGGASAELSSSGTATISGSLVRIN